MKTILHILWLFAFTFNLAEAQNRVTVTQKGSNNKVNIRQSTKADSINQSKHQPLPCYKMDTTNSKNEKNVITLKKKDGSGTNSYTVSGRAKNKLYLSQNGNEAENVLGIDINIDRLTAVQKGAGNGIILYVSKDESNKKQAGSRFYLEQKGAANAIYIGPCKSGQQKTSTKDSVKVTQKGSGNSVIIDN